MEGLLKRPKRAKREPDITPMIDVVFQLIIFFMVTSSFTPDQDFFEIILPQAKATQIVPEDNTFVICIDKSGEFFIPSVAQKTPVDRRDLAAIINQNNAGRIIMIKADKQTEYQNITTVLEILHGLGLESFSLGVQDN